MLVLVVLGLPLLIFFVLPIEAILEPQLSEAHSIRQCARHVSNTATTIISFVR